MILTNPNLLNRVLGAIGEHFAQKKNPRVQMGQAPMMAQAPVAQAPVAQGPTIGYAPVTAYAPAPVGQAAYVTPESTCFAPCNTYNAPCKYHGGPCPGPGPQYAPAPSGPAPSPQSGYGYSQNYPSQAPQALRKSYLSRIMGH